MIKVLLVFSYTDRADKKVPFHTLIKICGLAWLNAASRAEHGLGSPIWARNIFMTHIQEKIMLRKVLKVPLPISQVLSKSLN